MRAVRLVGGERARVSGSDGQSAGGVVVVDTVAAAGAAVGVGVGVGVSVHAQHLAAVDLTASRQHWRLPVSWKRA